MQHLERYCRSAKSYAAHLTRLCCGVEHNGDARVYAAIQKWLNGQVTLQKPDILPSLGALTIAAVRAAGGSADERNQMVWAWVESVWQAYAPQHALARSWVDLALAGQSSPPPGQPTSR